MAVLHEIPEIKCLYDHWLKSILLYISDPIKTAVDPHE